MYSAAGALTSPLLPGVRLCSTELATTWQSPNDTRTRLSYVLSPGPIYNFFILTYRHCVTGRHSVDSGMVVVELIGAHRALNHIDCGHRDRERATRQKGIRRLYAFGSLYAPAGRTSKTAHPQRRLARPPVSQEPGYWCNEQVQLC